MQLRGAGANISPARRVEIEHSERRRRICHAHQFAFGWIAGAGDPAERELMRMTYPPAALAVLDFDAASWADIRPGAAQLHRFVTPAILRGELVDDPD